MRAHGHLRPGDAAPRDTAPSHAAPSCPGQGHSTYRGNLLRVGQERQEVDVDKVALAQIVRNREELRQLRAVHKEVFALVRKGLATDIAHGLDGQDGLHTGTLCRQCELLVRQARGQGRRREGGPGD